MNIPLDLQGIIAQIRTNQEQIKLLTDNNAMLTEFLQLKGIEQNHIAFAETHPEFTRQQRQPPVRPLALLPAATDDNSTTGAAPAAPRRGRPPKTTAATAATASGGGWKGYRGSKIEMMIGYARDHGGDFDVRQFQEWYRSMGYGPPSFLKTTVYGQCRTMARRGYFKKLDSTHYTLTKKGVKLAGASAAPAAPAEPAPALKAAAGKTTTEKKRRSYTWGHLPKIKDYAKRHSGVFDAIGFRDEWTRMGYTPKTYTKTTIFTDLRNMAEQGIVKKIGPGTYKVLEQ